MKIYFTSKIWGNVETSGFIVIFYVARLASMLLVKTS
jgi:hypothetical protein